MSTSYNPQIVTSGLVLALDAANRKSYPGSGTTWNDLSGLGNTGTLTGGPNYVASNNVILFDGTNDYVSGANSASTDLTTDMTIEIWFKIDGVITSDYVRIFGKGDATNRTYGLWYHVAQGLWLYQRYGGGFPGASVISPSYPVNLQQWYHMVGTSNGSSHVLYLNGVSVATGTAATPVFSSAEGYRIGGATFHTFHNGPIASVRLYNRGLSATEVLQNYNAYRGRFGI
jgi:hypothetical protein